MTTFELVGIVLDELYEAIESRHGKTADEIIKGQFEYLEQAYKRVGAADNAIQYGDPSTQFAYVFTHLTAHADYLVQLMQRLPADDEVFTAKNLRLVSFGSGPGTDVIGVLKYLATKSTSVERMTCHLLDQEPAWEETWRRFEKNLNPNVSLLAKFRPWNLTESGSCDLEEVSSADCFILSYFASEVYSAENVIAFWSELFRKAKPGALFFYSDNGVSFFNRTFDDECRRAGLECLESGDRENIGTDTLEEKSVLQKYMKKFGRRPALGTKLTYRVLRKRT